MRRIAKISIAAVAGTAAVLFASTPAYALTNYTVRNPSGEDAGYANWNADPTDLYPGDALRACDTNADGFGVKVYATIPNAPDRTLTTQGHPAGYCTPWDTGNLTEGTKVTLLVCSIQGSWQPDCDEYIVYA